jgi:molybdopterin molybdotransferase
LRILSSRIAKGLFKSPCLRENSRVIELEEAVQQILAAMPVPASESVPLGEAHERVLSGRLLAAVDLPAFDNSAMDGYAVRADDVAAAKPDAPVGLRLRGKVAAGESFAAEIAQGECVRLFTGSPMPRGADAVVMQEDTRVDLADAGQVLVCDAVKPWENVRPRGTDVKRGAVLAAAGENLTAGKISLLAASGVAEVNVNKQPRVGLLATGSELREAGQDLAPGQIYESNRLTLAGLVRRAGGLPQIFPLVPDNADATRRALEDTFAACDIVVTSGGVSVGELDFVKAAFEKLGGGLQFWKVAIRPGKPFVFGRWGEKFLFGLPGNPVSAVVTFLLLARPAIRRWQGAGEAGLPAHSATLAEPLANPGERRHFMRVRVDAAGNVFSAGLQASHALFSLAAANGLVDVPARTTLTTGKTVAVIRWT